jgi:hypothetical protein
MDFPPPSPAWNRWCRVGAAALLVLGVALVFLVPADWLVGSAQADLGQQFLAWRAFAAASLRTGQLPRWNPYSYSGEPFLAGFQSAVFYPPNLIFLVLPLCRAVNLSLLLHGFILAWGMFRWARQRGLHPAAAALCGLALPFTGPVFPQLYAGHLSNLCTLAWAPWVLSGLERWHRHGDRRGLLLASAAVAAQILAGQIQYVFFIAVAAAIQAAGAALSTPAARRRALPGLAAAYLFGGALAAAQLVPGLAAAGEGVRQHQLGPAFAGAFSFPPENLLTAIAPGFFGDPVRHLYWGRCYPWEMSLELGVSGFLLLAVGTAAAPGRRAVWRDLGAAALLLVLALGRHGPLFAPLYAYAPGFDRFRGWSKFAFPAGLFLVLAIGSGADALLRRFRPPRLLATSAIAVGGALLLAGIGLASRTSLIAPLLGRVRDSAESYLPAATFTDPAVIRAAGTQAGHALAQAGVLALLGGVLLALARTRPRAGAALLALLPVELLAFAATQFAHFRESAAVPADLRAFVAAHPGDYRVQDLLAPNNGFLLGAPDIWGNDPALPARYAEFIAYSQGEDPDLASQNVTFRSLPPIYSLLRLRFLFTHPAGGLKVYEVPGGLEQVQLVAQYRVVAGRGPLLAALCEPGFDPRQTVLLEREPSPRPEPGAGPGRVRILSQSADRLTIEADAASPSLLLITDAYSRDWRARALPGSSQDSYEILPADYVVRATPLAAGHHRIEYDYEPRGLAAGFGLSAAAWLAGAGLWLRCRSRP